MGAAGGDPMLPGEDNSGGVGPHPPSNGGDDNPGKLTRLDEGRGRQPDASGPLGDTIRVRTRQSEQFVGVLLQHVNPTKIEAALRTRADEQTRFDASVLYDDSASDERIMHTFDEQSLQYEPALTVGGEYVAKDGECRAF